LTRKLSTSKGGNRAARALRKSYTAIAQNTIDFIPQGPGRNIDPEGLGGYLCDLRHKARETADSLTTDGSDSIYAWPIPIAQAALGFWELRIEGEPVDDDFLRLADWFVEHREETAMGTLWRADIEVPKYGLRPGWISAMAQGQAISVLLRAAKLSGEEVYADLAVTAIGPLLTPISSGGLQREINGTTVLEEYPTEKPCAVLNGWIFALWGVHELAVTRDHAAARRLFAHSSAGLLRLLPSYDIGWWSLYSLYDHGRRDLAKPFYQDLHPVMLDGLNLLRPDPRLRYYADRWRAQATRLNLARASANKLFFRISREIRQS
jgi:heparosan-N-sulfate-glucuronate 5-epimerase